MSVTEEEWNSLVANHETAIADWRLTNDALAELPPAEELQGQAGRDHHRAIATLDAAEDAILEAVPPSGAAVAYQFRIAAERYLEIEVEENPKSHEDVVQAAIFRRVYATLLAVK